jgi:hypothetical protein
MRLCTGHTFLTEQVLGGCRKVKPKKLISMHNQIVIGITKSWRYRLLIENQQQTPDSSSLPPQKESTIGVSSYMYPVQARKCQRAELVPG